VLKITQTKKTENNEMKNRIEDKSQRKSAVIVGVLILIGYGVLFSGGLEPLIVMLIELISGVAVIGIAFIMFPILKPYNKGLTLGYVVCKVVEGAILIIGGILLLSLSTTLLEVRDWIYVSQAYIFILGALIFYYLLYRSKLIPRFISVWGVIAAIMLLVGNLLEIMGFSPEMLMFLFLPIMLNEVFLAIWLIVKGFNADAIVSKAVKTDVN
jgi:hypothetical protein